MKSILKNLYHLLVPKIIRRQIKIINAPKPFKKLRKKVLDYYISQPKELVAHEVRQVISYLEKNPISVFPYEFQEKYNSNNIKVIKDKILGLFYVLYNEKRVYFKRSWSEEKIAVNWNMLRMEQDNSSPHRYLIGNFQVGKNDIVADIGCAEGNFVLSIIDNVNKVYLFEGDQEWIECLEATFSPWKNKVVIINKYVSSSLDENHITMNLYFKKINLTFIKVDIEGSEMEFFKGSEEILNRNSALKIAITTYHNQEDGDIFQKYLMSLGFATSFSNGYMFYLFGKTQQPPYLRKGVMRAVKINSISI